jgi:hypothetical protein
MSLIAKNKGGGSFALVPEDQHVARCVRIIDIGTQDGTYGPKHQCIIAWELPECQQVFDADRGPEPSLMSSFYTLSLNEKSNLRRVLEQWRAKAFTDQELEGFDVSSVISVPCLIQVLHKLNAAKEPRAIINSINRLPRGMTCPPQILDSLVFTLEDGTWEQFELIPEWQRELIKKCPEYPGFVSRINGGPNSQSADEHFQQIDDAGSDDEVPF